MGVARSSHRRRTASLGAQWRSAQWYIVATGAAASFVLGVAGFTRHFELVGEQRSLLDAVYLSLQLFTLESGAVTPPVPLALGIARFLAPAATVLGAAAAAVALLGERLSRFRLRFARGHVVVCGLGDRGQRIAEEFIGAGYRVAVIEQDERDPHVEQAREVGVVVLIGDASDDLALGQARAHRARYVVAVCAEDGTNAAIAVRLAALRAEKPQPQPTTAIVHVRDTELCEMLAQSASLSCGVGNMRLEFFNVPRAGAAAMLAAVPPVSRDPDRSPRIAIVGLGRLGRSLALQVARAWWFERDAYPGRPEMTLVDADARGATELLRARAPRFDETCALRILDLPTESPAFERGGFLLDGGGRIAVDAVYVCLDEDPRSLAAALSVRRLTGAARVPIAVRMSSDAGLASLAVAAVGDFSDLRAVGVLDVTCSLEALLGGLNESVARAVHADYVRREREAGRTVAENPSLVAWEALPETLKESNRRQADDIRQKMRSARMRIVPLDDWAEEPDTFTLAEVERLAIAEHDRWVRERLDQGWRYALGEKDTDRRTSPYLVPWGDLTDDIRELDRGAIRAIPALLAGAGLTMRREEPV